MQEVDPYTEHHKECACTFCSKYRLECNGTGHDWRPLPNGTMYCKKCALKAHWVRPSAGAPYGPYVKVFAPVEV